MVVGSVGSELALVGVEAPLVFDLSAGCFESCGHDSKAIRSRI